MLGLEHAPLAVVELVARLQRNGFRQVDDQKLDSGNQHAVFEDGTTRVVVNAHRGDWSLGIGLVDFADTFHPDIWETYLDGSPVEGVTSLDHQAAFVERRWAAALQAAATDRQCEAKLQAIDQEYVRHFLGL